MVSQEQFLTALFEESLQQGQYIETRDILPDKSIVQEFHVTIEGVINYAPKGNYYFGVCPRKIKSGKETNIETIVSLWVDFDVTIEMATDKLNTFPLKPSIVVNSGNGVHVYWLLKEPESIRPNTKGILKGLALTLGADHCYDLPRVLRVPGTKNLKDPNNPKDVQVVVFNPEIRYNLSDFDSYEIEIQKKSEVPISFSSEAQEVDLEDFQVGEDVRGLILNGKQDGDKYKSWSEADFAVVCGLVKTNCSDDTIKAIFDKYPIGKKYKEQGEAYLKHTIDKARQSMGSSTDCSTRNDSIDRSLVDGGRISFNSTKVADRIIDERRIINCADTFYEYMDGCYRFIGQEIVQGWIMDTVGERLTKRQMEEIVCFVKTRAYIEVNQLNNTDLLNLKNGLFALETYNVLPHSPDVYSTIQLTVDYKPRVDCPKWKLAIKQIFQGDTEKMQLMQEFFGLCLTKETKYERALICLGEGANGKSVILNTLGKLLGKDNWSAIPLEKFDNTHYVANLFGKVANISIETNAKSQVYDSTFKAVVSGDPITADPKFKKPFTFNPFSKLIFAMNNLPRVDDKTEAFFRRLLILKFDKEFKDQEQNKNLKEELEAELDGIFIWALEGLKRLRERKDFHVGGNMKAEIDNYRKENNNVMIFVEEICAFDLEAVETKGRLYNMYSCFCKNTGYLPLSLIKFGKELGKRFKNIRSERVDGAWVWVGIKGKYGPIVHRY